MNRTRSSRLLAAGSLAAASAFALAGPAQAHSGATGLVFEATNAAAGNAVQVFIRAADGTLSTGPLVPTGGKGSGASLASQGGIVRDGDRLLVVNAGDDTISSFAVNGHGLRRSDVAPSGGSHPVSVTVHDGLVYVLNAGSDSISALRLDSGGDLQPVPGSSRPLSATGTGAAEIEFDATGESLVVTEKATNTLDSWTVGRDGRAYRHRTTTSPGSTPYGFDIDAHNHVIVSEAATASLSSYRLHDGELRVRTGALGDTQAAPCWVIVSADSRYAWTTNAASATISSYRIAADGRLTLLAAVAASTAAGPTDLALSAGGRFVYARQRDGSVAAFRVGANGSLTSLGSTPASAAIGSSGLAAL